MKNGQVSSAFKSTTIADGIAVKTPGDMTFEIIKELVDEVVLVEEEEIAQGIVYLMENLKVVAEGSGAVTTAALLSGKLDQYIQNRKTVSIISGGNIDLSRVSQITGFVDA